MIGSIDSSRIPHRFWLLGEILRKASRLGRVIWGHIKARCLLRANGAGFNTVDVTRTIRTGTVISAPKYDSGWHAYSFEIAASVEGRKFVLDCLLHCDEDYYESPLVSFEPVTLNTDQ